MSAPGDAVGCRALFVAVLHQALSDALHLPLGSAEQRQADAWLRAGGSWFGTVCHLADVDPVQVRARYIAGKIDLPRYAKSGRPAGRPSKRAAV